MASPLRPARQLAGGPSDPCRAARPTPPPGPYGNVVDSGAQAAIRLPLSIGGASDEIGFWVQVPLQQPVIGGSPATPAAAPEEPGGWSGLVRDRIGDAVATLLPAPTRNVWRINRPSSRRPGGGSRAGTSLPTTTRPSPPTWSGPPPSAWAPPPTTSTAATSPCSPTPTPSSTSSAPPPQAFEPAPLSEPLRSTGGEQGSERASPRPNTRDQHPYCRRLAEGCLRRLDVLRRQRQGGSGAIPGRTQFYGFASGDPGHRTSGCYEKRTDWPRAGAS
jgi:hypothetical protein